MRPAVLAHLIGGLHVEILAGVQLLHQLPPQLQPASLLVAFLLELTQTLMRAADDEVTEADALAAAAQLLELIRLSEELPGGYH